MNKNTSMQKCFLFCVPACPDLVDRRTGSLVEDHTGPPGHQRTEQGGGPWSYPGSQTLSCSSSLEEKARERDRERERSFSFTQIIISIFNPQLWRFKILTHLQMNNVWLFSSCFYVGIRRDLSNKGWRVYICGSFRAVCLCFPFSLYLLTLYIEHFLLLSFYLSLFWASADSCITVRDEET